MLCFVMLCYLVNLCYADLESFGEPLDGTPNGHLTFILSTLPCESILNLVLNEAETTKIHEFGHFVRFLLIWEPLRWPMNGPPRTFYL